jgi:hypothetical protein
MKIVDLITFLLILLLQIKTKIKFTIQINLILEKATTLDAKQNIMFNDYTAMFNDYTAIFTRFIFCFSV